MLQSSMQQNKTDTDGDTVMMSEGPQQKTWIVTIDYIRSLSK